MEYSTNGSVDKDLDGFVKCDANVRVLLVELVDDTPAHASKWRMLKGQRCSAVFIARSLVKFKKHIRFNKLSKVGHTFLTIDIPTRWILGVWQYEWLRVTLTIDQNTVIDNVDVAKVGWLVT